MSEESNAPEAEKPTFKAPLMVGKVSGKKTTFKVPMAKAGAPFKQETPVESSTSNEPIPKLFPPQKCSYEEPDWAGVPETYYRITILRNGTIVGNKKLTKSHFVIGRHQDCDIILEHPSISRFHAVLQYRRPPASASDSAKKLKGFYLYDLGSTHGTRLNKEPVDPKSYRRVRVGHQFKFGFSSRVFILEGPEDDEEPESEMTVTEIIQRRKKLALERKINEGEESQEAKPKDEEQVEDSGINWGMADDAEEEEDDEKISDVNPFSLNNPSNEQLYLDDPKKTLRGWFEREGYELEYKVEDKGLGQFHCRVELPIDTGSGRSVVAEAVLKGKKKEAVVQCALEACRILDKYGELRKAHHDARKRKTKNWKEDEYYDSDEDEFLDRTGDLAQKRAQRKARLEKTQVVETYATLKEKIETIDARIAVIQKDLENSKAAEALNKEAEGDCLDSFMKMLKSGTALDKAKRSQLRSEQSKLLLERQQLVKLANIAKPVDLPPLKIAPLPGKSSSSSSGGALPMVGSLKGRKRPVLPLVGMAAKVSRMQADDSKEESDHSDEDDVPQSDQPKTSEAESEGKASEKPTRVAGSPAGVVGVKDVPPPVENRKEPEFTALKEERNLVKFKQNSRTLGPTLPPGHLKANEEGNNEAKKLKASKPSSIQPTIDAATTSAILSSEDADFEDWVPPKGQTGDGKTALNDKFGY